MIRKFDCKNCKKQFNADDQHIVLCPYCQSDNVEPTSFHVSMKTWKILAVIVIFLLSCSTVYSLIQCGGDTSNSNSFKFDESFPVEKDTDSIGFDYDEIIPPTVKVSQPVCDNEGFYSVEVKAKNVSNNTKYYYVMISHFDKKVLQKSNDGHFSNIHYCDEDSHSYDFAIMDSKSDTLLCVPIEQTGFVRQVTIDSSKKMTADELQKLIDKKDESLNGVGESDYLAPDYQLKFIGLPSDVKIQSWTDLFEMLEYEVLKSVTVSQIGYDNKNRIKMITLKVAMP